MKNRYKIEIQHEGCFSFGSYDVKNKKEAETQIRLHKKEPTLKTIRLRVNGWLTRCETRTLFPNGTFHNSLTWSK